MSLRARTQVGAVAQRSGHRRFDVERGSPTRRRVDRLELRRSTTSRLRRVEDQQRAADLRPA